MKRTIHKNISLSLAVTFLLVLLIVFKFETIPPVWWDEGWTMLVAKNWVERGHFGQLLEGLPSSLGLTASPAVIAPLAGSFRLFGFGVWQARLPALLFSLGALALLYGLGWALYNRRVAAATLILLFLLPVSTDLHPLLVGRQVLGEMLMLFYLLVGYACLYLSLKRGPLYLLAAAFFWGIALKTKAQVFPFWLLSLLVPFGAALLARRWRMALLLALGIAGGWAWGELSIRLAYRYLVGPTVAGGGLEGLYGVTALVPYIGVRRMAWAVAFSVGLPVLAGLVYAAWGSIRRLQQPGFDGGIEFTRLALLAFAGSWFAWYVSLAMAWERYFFPAFFVGCPFAAALFHDLSGGFQFGRAFRETARLLGEMRRGARAAFKPFLAPFAALMVAVWVGVTGLATIFFLILQFSLLADGSVTEVAAYLNASDDPGALVESYESEVFFFLERPYHYPPDQLHVQLNRRWMIDPDTPVDYDPLAADPDYLVVGPMGRQWELYDPVLEQGAFRLVMETRLYQVYARVRP